MKYGKVLIFLLLVCGPLFAQLPEGEAQLPEEANVPNQAPPPAQPQGKPAPTTAAEPPAKAGDKKEEPAPPSEEKIYLNVNDQDIKEVIKQVVKATGRNIILDSKVTGKITILSNKMMTKNEAYQAFLSALSVTGFTVVEGPGGVLKIIPLRDAKNFPIPTHIDTTPLTDSYITRLIKLENISANAMSDAIKGLISRDGNLFAYPETNTLVVTDSGSNIDRLMKIIKELDQEGPQQVVEIIPLHYASAKDIAGIVLNLFQEEARGARPGGAGGGAEEIAKVSKIIADDRTNSILVLASKMAIEKVKNLINKLDAKLEEGNEGKIHVYYLKHAKAKDIATVLQGLSGSAAKPAGQAGGAPAAGGTVVAELEEFKVASDDTTNSLLITATGKTFQILVDKVISKLDIPRKQVYLEAMIVEFILTRAKSVGVSWSAGGPNSSIMGIGQTFQQLAGLIDPLNAANTRSPFLTAPGLLGGVLSRKTANIQVTRADGTTQTVSVPAFSAFLTALSTFGDTNVVASPSLLALDNEEATIEITRKEPEPGQTTISATGLQQVGTPNRIEAGLKLKLTPQVTERGTVRLDIDQTFSFFSDAANVRLGTQAIQERKVKTSVVTDDGQTVVIGGLMQDTVTQGKQKIPILGDIPLLGYLFQQKNSNKSKNNLMLFITPHIIHDSGDFNKVLQRKMGQEKDFLAANFKKKDQNEIKATVKAHSNEIFDILDGRSIPSQAGPTEDEKWKTSIGEPVITAKPEEEPPLTISIPADSNAGKEILKQADEEKKRKKVEPPPAVIAIPPKKKEEAKATPPPPAPAPSSSDHAPVITLPTGTPPQWEE